VRELQNVIERAVILCSDGEDLQVEHLGFTPPAGAPAAVPVQVQPVFSGSPAFQSAGSDQHVSLAEIEKQHILRILEKCEGNRTNAADKLGISIRTLRNKLNEYGVPGKGEQGGSVEEVSESEV
jgi:DNA-binding NtrC family response regulator